MDRLKHVVIAGVNLVSLSHSNSRMMNLVRSEGSAGSGPQVRPQPDRHAGSRRLHLRSLAIAPGTGSRHTLDDTTAATRSINRCQKRSSGAGMRVLAPHSCWDHRRLCVVATCAACGRSACAVR
eukprot:2928751-Pleurochrysis_carterae.AAC.1